MIYWVWLIRNAFRRAARWPYCCEGGEWITWMLFLNATQQCFVCCTYAELLIMLILIIVVMVELLKVLSQRLNGSCFSKRLRLQ